MAANADWIRVELTTREIASAQAEARDRNQRARRDGCRARGGTDGSRTADLIGALGEHAVAQYLGLPPPRGTWQEDHARGWDVGGWNVRTVSRPGNRLFLREHERRGVWCLVAGHQATHGICYLVGWITAGEAWKHAVRRQDIGQPYYVVDTVHLIPLPPVTRPPTVSEAA